MYEIGDVIFYIDDSSYQFALSEIINIHEFDDSTYIVLQSGKVLPPERCFIDLDDMVLSLKNNMIENHPKTAKGSFVDDDGIVVMWERTSQKDVKPGLVYIPNESLEKASPVGILHTDWLNDSVDIKPIAVKFKS